MRNKLLPPPPPAARNPRCTGRTTAIALQAIAAAIASQGDKFYAVDHHAQGDKQRAEELLRRIHSLILRLELQHMRVEVQTFNAYSKVVVWSNIWED